MVILIKKGIFSTGLCPNSLWEWRVDKGIHLEEEEGQKSSEVRGLIRQSLEQLKGTRAELTFLLRSALHLWSPSHPEKHSPSCPTSGTFELHL